MIEEAKTEKYRDIKDQRSGSGTLKVPCAARKYRVPTAILSEAYILHVQFQSGIDSCCAY